MTERIPPALATWLEQPDVWALVAMSGQAVVWEGARAHTLPVELSGLEIHRWIQTLRRVAGGGEGGAGPYRGRLDDDWDFVAYGGAQRAAVRLERHRPRGGAPTLEPPSVQAWVDQAIRSHRGGLVAARRLLGPCPVHRSLLGRWRQQHWVHELMPGEAAQDLSRWLELGVEVFGAIEPTADDWGALVFNPKPLAVLVEAPDPDAALSRVSALVAASRPGLAWPAVQAVLRSKIGWVLEVDADGSCLGVWSVADGGLTARPFPSPSGSAGPFQPAPGQPSRSERPMPRPAHVAAPQPGPPDGAPALGPPARAAAPTDAQLRTGSYPEAAAEPAAEPPAPAANARPKVDSPSRRPIPSGPVRRPLDRRIPQGSTPTVKPPVTSKRRDATATDAVPPGPGTADTDDKLSSPWQETIGDPGPELEPPPRGTSVGGSLTLEPIGRPLPRRPLALPQDPTSPTQRPALELAGPGASEPLDAESLMSKSLLYRIRQDELSPPPADSQDLPSDRSSTQSSDRAGSDSLSSLASEESTAGALEAPPLTMDRTAHGLLDAQVPFPEEDATHDGASQDLDGLPEEHTPAGQLFDPVRRDR